MTFALKNAGYDGDADLVETFLVKDLEFIVLSKQTYERGESDAKKAMGEKEYSDFVNAMAGMRATVDGWAALGLPPGATPIKYRFGSVGEKKAIRDYLCLYREFMRKNRFRSKRSALRKNKNRRYRNIGMKMIAYPRDGCPRRKDGWGWTIGLTMYEVRCLIRYIGQMADDGSDENIILRLRDFQKRGGDE